MKNKFISGIIVASIGFGLMLPAAHALDKGIMNVDEARALLSTGKSVQSRYELVDVTQEDPQVAIDISNAHFQYGVSTAFQDIKKHTQDQHLIDIAKTIGGVFQRGDMHLPSPVDLTNNNLKQAVQQAYDIILNTFCWENGHTTEINSFEVAAYMVTRARLLHLKSLWN